MPSRSLEGCELWSTIRNDAFGSISEEGLVRQVYAAFREETNRLKGALVAERSTPPLIMLNDAQLPPTPSQLLFDEDFDEVNRTYLGVLALRWLLTGNYRKFVRGQLEEVKLSEESFKWLKGYYEENLRSHQDLFALLLSMVVNDLGKDPNLVEDCYRMATFPMSGSNHDVVLLEAARQGMVPCLDYLDEPHRQDIMLGLELGSELNAGQLAQAENVPVNLEGLLHMRNHEHAFNMKFMEQILDVAGAAGHVFADGVKNLIEPVFQAFKTVLDVSLSIVRGESTLKEGYNLVLSKRAKLLENEGFRPLSVGNREQRALLRLLTMGRTATYKQAKLFDDAFQALESVQKEHLISGLNIDAIDDNETAVIPYYMPAMIAETIKNTQDSGNEQEALTSLLRYLARTLHWTAEDEPSAVPKMLSTVKEEKAATWPPTLHIPVNTGRVYERNMTKARETISSPQFKRDPSVLDKLDTPEGYLVQRRRTSQSA